ncbi:MAG: hypothetical protein ABI761_04870 [Saprospiraceae bacterium]
MNEVINIKETRPATLPGHRASLFFYGDEGNPFLAPRGLHIVQDKLIVADTAQNRIFIWNKIPTSSYQVPDVVLGQQHTTDTQRNAGEKTNASSLLYPSGIWSDGNKLIVADAWNHRVLVWHVFPTRVGQPADTVIGQPTMMDNLPNVEGVGSMATRNNLYWPYGVWSDGIRLWIADTGNRRVLFFETIPESNYSEASRVIGQNSFEEKDYNGDHAIWPYSVKVSEHGTLVITDTQYYRILIWNQWKDAFESKPNVIVGQPDLKSCGQNQYRLKPSANTLNWCYDASINNDKLWIVDTGNSRVLSFKTIPTHHNAEADDLYGNIHFEAIGEHLEVGQVESERLYWPFAVSVIGHSLVVADTGNHRIVFYTI